MIRFVLYSQQDGPLKMHVKEYWLNCNPKTKGENESISAVVLMRYLFNESCNLWIILIPKIYNRFELVRERRYVEPSKHNKN